MNNVVLQCLCNASNFDPPMFHNLLFLQLEGSCVSHLLPLLLQRAPDLELLTFRKVCYVHIVHVLPWPHSSIHLIN
jgi:hypothetical protein